MASASTPPEATAASVTWALCPALTGRPVKVTPRGGLGLLRHRRPLSFPNHGVFDFESKLVQSVCGGVRTPARPFLFYQNYTQPGHMVTKSRPLFMGLGGRCEHGQFSTTRLCLLLGRRTQTRVLCSVGGLSLTIETQLLTSAMVVF